MSNFSLPLDIYYASLKLANFAVVITDNKFNVIFANDEALNIINIEKENVLNKSITDFFKIKNRLIDMQRISKRLFKNQFVCGRLKNVLIKDHFVYKIINYKICVINNENNINYIIYFNIENCPDNKKAKNVLKITEDYIGSLSHDLRTPLNIISNSALLLTNSEENIIKKHANIIKYNCNRLIKISNNIIDITKSELGILEPKKTKFDLIELINEIIFAISDFALIKNLQISFNSEVKTAIISYDKDMLYRVILNLLSNAIKFSKKDKKIEISVRHKNKTDKTLVLSVKDYGIGIPKNSLKTIFEKYKQLDNSLTKQNEGSGLGLAIVNGIANLHGGKAYAKSVLGEGSEFFVEIDCLDYTSYDRVLEDKHTNYYYFKENKHLNNLIEVMLSEFF